MKKIFVMGALAVAIAAISQQQASAWGSWRFGVGLNMARESGGNTWLWGAFRNGQPPGPDCGPNGGPYGSPYGYGQGPTPMPYFGQSGQPGPMYSRQPPPPPYGYQPPPPPAQPPAVQPQNGNVPAVYRPLPVYNGAYYYPTTYYR
jgi:hypothetical protein